MNSGKLVFEGLLEFQIMILMAHWKDEDVFYIIFSSGAEKGHL